MKSLTAFTTLKKSVSSQMLASDFPLAEDFENFNIWLMIVTSFFNSSISILVSSMMAINLLRDYLRLPLKSSSTIVCPSPLITLTSFRMDLIFFCDVLLLNSRPTIIQQRFCIVEDLTFSPVSSPLGMPPLLASLKLPAICLRIDDNAPRISSQNISCSFSSKSSPVR